MPAPGFERSIRRRKCIRIGHGRWPAHLNAIGCCLQMRWRERSAGRHPGRFAARARDDALEPRCTLGRTYRRTERPLTSGDLLGEQLEEVVHLVQAGVVDVEVLVRGPGKVPAMHRQLLDPDRSVVLRIHLDASGRYPTLPG